MTMNADDYNAMVNRRSELRVLLAKFYREGDTSHPNLQEKHLINELDDINLKLMKGVKVEKTVGAEVSIWK